MSMNLVIANGLLLLMVLIELAFISFKKKETIPWREVVFNLNSGHILMWILRGTEITAFYFVTTYWSLSILDNWSYPLIWLFTFIAWDFCFYWLHRFHHKFKFLWAIHVIHHEGEHFSLSLGIRNSWYSSLTSFPFFFGLALIGVPVEVFIATSSIHYFVQFYNHNSIVKQSGWLEKILITPAHHRVHHGVNSMYIDRNFGGTFVLWDKLFGTFQQELEAEPVVFGVKNYEKNYNVAWANNLPFLKLLKYSGSNTKKEKISYTIDDRYIAIGGVLLFGLLLYYISIEQAWSLENKLQFFCIIFLGTIANGGISEHKVWGLIFWCFTFVILSPAFILYHNLTGPILIILLGLLAAHSLIILFTVKRNILTLNS